MLERSSIVNSKVQGASGVYFELVLSQRAAAAFLAISERLAELSFAARALPPFNPPRRPSVTAAGFFWVFFIDSVATQEARV